jgi:hypothetical protein
VVKSILKKPPKRSPKDKQPSPKAPLLFSKTSAPQSEICEAKLAQLIPKEFTAVNLRRNLLQLISEGIYA